MPPTNTNAANATVITSLPATITQDAHDAGTTYDLYFRITPTFTGVISVFGYGGEAGIYRPRMGCSPAPWPSGEIVAVRNRPLLLPVTAGQEYFIECAKVSGNPTPAVLTLSLERASERPITSAAYLINDDFNGFPAAIVSSLEDHVVLKFLHPFPAGEAGDRLLNGATLFADSGSDNDIKFYDAAFTQVATAPFDVSFAPAIRAHHPTSTFYAGRATSPAQVKKFSSTGVEMASLALTGHNGINGLAVNADESILYHSRGSTTIRRWDMNGSADLPDLATALTGYTNGYDIIVLPDGTILASYYHSGTNDFHARRYSDGGPGTLLATYPIGTSVGASTVPRIAYAPAYPDRFFTLWFPGTGLSRLQAIRVSDGAVLSSRTHTLYETGAYQGAETATPTSRYGHSFCCPLVVLGVVPILDPSVPSSCCEDACGCAGCCGTGRRLSAGHAGALGDALPESGSTLTPPTPDGRLLPATADPTYPERWA